MKIVVMNVQLKKFLRSIEKKIIGKELNKKFF